MGKFGCKRLDRTTRFYTAIGFKSNGSSNELTSFKVGDDDFIIHFFLKDVLKSNIHGELVDLKHGNEIVFTLSASSKGDVDTWAAEVEKAGGEIVSSPEEFGEGYYGFVFAILTGISLMCFIWKAYRQKRKAVS